MGLREALKAGPPVIGTFVTLPSASFVEVSALAGFDFVVIDLEHAALDVGEAENLVRAAELRGAAPIIRVAHNSPHHILKALDTGAVGVHIPNVDTPEQARAAVASCKYGPVGSRGLAGVRASGFGVAGTLADYAARANEETVVIAHIESRTSIDRLDELLEVDGIDVYYLGPVDLSNDLGVPGRLDDPRVQELVETAIKKIAAAGKTPGCIFSDSATALSYKALGVRYFACHALRFMVTGGREFIAQVRE